MTELLEHIEEPFEPEAPDDAFVVRVMTAVRSHGSVRWVLFRRPVVLGLAAAIAVTGGAVAAMMREPAPPPNRDAAAEPPHGSETAPTAGKTPAERSKPSRPAANDRPAAAASGDEREPDRPWTFKKDGMEWGYGSAHTAYVHDTEAGLRLETETYDVDLAVGRPQRVTLTLSNTGREPIAIRSDGGCLLEVTVAAEDGTSRPVCAHASDAERSGVMLDVHQTLSADAQIVVKQPGAWHVVGACRCTYVNGGKQAPSKEEGSVTDDLDGLTGGNDPPERTQTQPRSGRLMTPPIRMTAS